MQSLLFDSSHRPLAQPVGIGKIRFKNAPQHLACAPIHFRNARMVGHNPLTWDHCTRGRELSELEMAELFPDQLMELIL